MGQSRESLLEALNDIWSRLKGISQEDLTTAEQQIITILIAAEVITKEEAKRSSVYEELKQDADS